eukprot:COSAG02_NODE_6905_length_3296_cov_2.525493_4_plen_454_part_01
MCTRRTSATRESMADYISTLARATHVGKDQHPTEPISKGTCEKRQRDGRRLVAYWQSQHPGKDIDWDAVFTAKNAKAAANWDFPAARQESQGQIVKDGTASKTLDSIAVSAMFFIRQHCHQQHSDGAPLPQACQLAIQQLERLQKSAKESAAAAKEAPPARSVFQRVAKELHAAILAHEEDDDMTHEMLSLHCMAVLTILGMPARSAAMRDYQWGRDITRGENGDYKFEVGTPGGTKNDMYCKFLLSGLNTIGQTGLLRPDLVATALDTLHGASSGTGLVFSRTADGESRFGDDRLRKFLKDHDLTVGDLRRRIETDADELGRRGVLSDQDRELVTYVCQHTVTAADEDYRYVQRDAASAERPLVRQNAVSDEELTSQRALVEDAATQNQGSAHADHAQQDDREGDTGADEAVPRRGATRIDWVARVAVHTERLYDLVTNDDCHSSKTLVQLNM